MVKTGGWWFAKFAIVVGYYYVGGWWFCEIMYCIVGLLVLLLASSSISLKLVVL